MIAKNCALKFLINCYFSFIFRFYRYNIAQSRKSDEIIQCYSFASCSEASKQSLFNLYIIFNRIETDKGNRIVDADID